MRGQLIAGNAFISEKWKDANKWLIYLAEKTGKQQQSKPKESTGNERVKAKAEFKSDLTHSKDQTIAPSSSDFFPDWSPGN